MLQVFETFARFENSCKNFILFKKPDGLCELFLQNTYNFDENKLLHIFFKAFYNLLYIIYIFSF